MERRRDLPTHPDDIQKPRKPYKKKVISDYMKCAELKKPKRTNNPWNPKYYSTKDDPYIENKDVWRAVQFVRSMINDENKPEPVELAVYKAAKYYKVSQKEVASQLGILANAYKQSRKG